MNVLGETGEARRWLAIAAAFDLREPRAIYNLACAYAKFGLISEALVNLENALQVGLSEGQRYFMKTADPDLMILRQDPRFDALVLRFET